MADYIGIFSVYFLNHAFEVIVPPLPSMLVAAVSAAVVQLERPTVVPPDSVRFTLLAPAVSILTRMFSTLAAVRAQFKNAEE